jgi:iron complex transport system substrate-binding protein
MRQAVIVVALVCAACGRSEQKSQTAGGARIVTLTPSATETVAALGATDSLVGVDQYSEYPASVKQLPKVGTFLQPNQEVIMSLHPTLVVVDDIHGQVAGALRDRGLETIECDMHALPDVKAALVRIGAKLGRAEKAKEVVAAIDHDLDAAAAAKPAKHPRVLVIIDREAGGLGNIVAAGPGSWLDELLAVVGGDNVLAASGVRYPKIGLEEILRAQPEVILDVSYAARSDMKPWDALDVPAVKTGRVKMLDEAYLTGPSPRVREALATLAEAIR